MSDADPGLTGYEKPTCSTCRNLFALLSERGIKFERVNYSVDPLSASENTGAAGQGWSAAA